jgi:BON domain
MLQASRILSGLFIALSVVTVGCSHRRDNSEQLVSKVQNVLRSDKRLMMARLQVTGVHRIITIRGYVVDENQRSAAVQDAWRVGGVKVVVDNLRLIDSSRLIVMVLKTPALVVRTSKKQKAGSSERVSLADSLYRSAFSKSLAARAGDIKNSTAGVPAASATDRGFVASTASTVRAIASSASIPVANIPSTALEEVTVPYGSVLSVRLAESLGSDVNEEGDTFLASLASPLRIGDRIVVPEGAAVQGKVVEVQNAARFSGKAALSLELSRLRYNGNTYDLHTNQYSKQGPSQDRRSVLTIAGGAGLGAILGAIFAGGKGAAIGAVAGAGTGTGAQAARKGTAVYLPAESRFSLRLEAPLTVVPSSTPQRTFNSGEDFSMDPFSPDYHPVLKRRPGSRPSEVPAAESPVAEKK